MCGVCRGENPPGMKFCRSCGSALAASVPTAVPAGMPPPMGGAPGMIGGAPGMPPIGGAPGMAPMGALPPMGPPPGPPPAFGAPPPAMLGGPQPSTLGGPAPLPPPPSPGIPPSTTPGSGGAARVPASAAAPGMISCPRCGTATPVGFAFCQQCGLHMQGMQPTDPAASARPREPSHHGSIPGASASSAASAAGTSPNARPLGVNPALANMAVDPQGATLAADNIRAGSIQPPGAAQPPMAPPIASPIASSPAIRPSAPNLAAGPSWGTAVLVNRDGTDGQRFPLAGEYNVIGRAGADIAFDDDRFLARQHARLERGGDGTVRIHALDTLNGVFKKADLPVELVDGTLILVGREVLRFERMMPEETSVHPLVRHGVALFGSPPREPWGRLMQIVPSGGYRDVRHLAGDEVVLGREEGDIVFRDDAFMSRRHAALTWDGKKAQITDLGSSNGTFVRITGPTALKSGDHVRMGDQLLRIELGK